MTPQEKVRWLILNNAIYNFTYSEEKIFPYPCDSKLLNKEWKLLENDDPDRLVESIEQVRCSGVETSLVFPTGYINLPVGFNELLKKYECKAVGSRMPNGDAVGWLYWTGYCFPCPAPKSIPWIEHAFGLTYKEKIVKKLVFSLSK